MNWCEQKIEEIKAKERNGEEITQEDWEAYYYAKGTLESEEAERAYLNGEDNDCSYYSEFEEEDEEFRECTWCGELFPTEELQEEVNLGCLCFRCKDAIWSRGEKLTFINKL